jgi:rhodanese-related sulfurtransferase
MSGRHSALALMLVMAGMPVLAEQAILQCDFKPTEVTQSVPTIEWHRESTRYISPYQLQHKISQAKPQLMVVDVRNADAYRHSHIEQSLNLPHSKLLSMPFFKHREVVLVGQGQSYRHLEDLHQKLLNRGFNNVKILDGGVDYWKSEIEGQSLLSRMDDLILINNAMGGDTDFWQIIDASNNPNLDQHFDDVITLDDVALLQSPRTFSQRFNQPKQLIKNVLLIIPEHMDAHQLLKSWRRQLKANVYAVGSAKAQSALQVYEHNRRIVQYKKRRTDGAKMSCS